LKLIFFIFIFAISTALTAQKKQPSLKDPKPAYFRHEEVIQDGKRYRVNNNYLTFGPGFLASSLRKVSQQSISIDYQFHVKREHFQVGVMMSGNTLGSNNNSQIHMGYGYRKESATTNFAFFAGPSYFTGVTGKTDSTGKTTPLVYTNFGLYLNASMVYKFTYDIGLGAEVFTEISTVQRLFGIKLIAFFSGAYVGPKKNYNPNVRSENPR
jgi:hypothetical protein